MDKPKVLVGRTVTIRPRGGAAAPDYFTDVHHARVGQRGRVHAVVAGDRGDPLVKVGFEEGTQIVFFRLADLEIDADAPLEPGTRHGARGSHLPREHR